MPGAADVDFAGIFFRFLKGKFHCFSGIRDGLGTDHNIVSMAAATLSIAWQHDGKYLCICFLHCVIHSDDLSCGANPGTDDSDTAVRSFHFHFFAKSRSHIGNDKTDRVKHRGSYKFW